MELKKVHIKEDGYWWQCTVDEEFVRGSCRLALFVGGIVCVIVMLLAFIVSSDTQTRLIFFASCGGVMLLVLMVCGILWLRRNSFRQLYELKEDFVRYGDSSRSQTSVFFKDVLRTEEEGNKIRLFTGRRKYLVYVPEEDYEAVRDLILARVEEQSKFH